jgi:hypothetical protein
MSSSSISQDDIEVPDLDNDQEVDYTEVDVPEEIGGWYLSEQSPNQLIWRSRGGYGVKVEGKFARVVGLVPRAPGELSEDDGQPKLRNKTVLRKKTGEIRESIYFAVSWLESSKIDYGYNRAEFSGIGHRTAEYLSLMHDVRTVSDLASEWSVIEMIVSSQYHQQLAEEIKNAVEERREEMRSLQEKIQNRDSMQDEK